MTPEQEKSIIFGVLMNTNPELAGGNWAEIAPKVGLGTEIVRPPNPSPPPSATMASIQDLSIHLLMRMLQSNDPTLAGANWKQIAAEMNLMFAFAPAKVFTSLFFFLYHLQGPRTDHDQTHRKRFAAMRKEFLENQANNGAGSAPAAAAASTPKKRARKSKITKPVDPEEDDDEVDGTPAKKQRRGRPSKKAETTAPKVEAGSENGADDEVSLKIWLRPHTSPWTPN
ncbi:hypothetical protein PG988_014385 [Apiospora saccharicola]